MQRAAILAAVVVAAGCGGTATDTRTAPAHVARFEGTRMSPARPAPKIELHDQDGELVRLSDLRGRYVLVTFLYTHCPDVCPLIASSLNTALRMLGPRRDEVRVLAVSVDPRGDTPAAVRAYVRRMHLLPQFRYLRGTAAELRPTWKAWNILAVARKPDVVDHAAYTQLVTPDGKRALLYGSRVRAQEVVHDLRILFKRRSAA